MRRLTFRNGDTVDYVDDLDIRADGTVGFTDASGSTRTVRYEDIVTVGLASGAGAHPDDEEYAYREED